VEKSLQNFNCFLILSGKCNSKFEIKPTLAKGKKRKEKKRKFKEKAEPLAQKFPSKSPSP